MNLKTGKIEYVKEIDLDHILKTKDLDEDFQGNDIALSDDGTVFRLENGVLNKYPLPEHDGNIVQLESCNNQLIVMTNDKIFIDTDGSFRELDVTFKMPMDNVLSIYAILIGLILLFWGILGLIIHIIIRKKGLLFKQLCFAVPILAILSVIVFFRIFDLSEKQSFQP